MANMRNITDAGIGFIKESRRAILRKAPLGRLLVSTYYRRHLKTVSLQDLRCMDSPFSAKYGFAGKPIQYFPPHRFFELHLQDPAAALKVFAHWLNERFIDGQGWKVSIREGGMRNGPLMREVIKVHQEHGILLSDNMDQANPDLVQQACVRRARHYLSVLDSIRDNGFNPALGGYPTGTFSENLCFLGGGHHRVAAMSTLGYTSVLVKGS